VKASIKEKTATYPIYEKLANDFPLDGIFPFVMYVSIDYKTALSSAISPFADVE
jgi:hypothetical protein